jgi:tetratricopeptide (TPR) repeat protein
MIAIFMAARLTFPALWATTPCVPAQKALVKLWWRLTLLGALLFLGADSARKLGALRAATALGENGRPAPVLAAASPTGYESGRRNLILESTDGYHWVMQTQQMIATGDWRLRRVGYDNAPDGREVHWCSPLHGWLAGVAWADHAVSGRPWLVSVEFAARYASPLLLGLFLLAVVPWAARRFGPMPAALLAAGLVAVAPFSAEFSAGSFDHHGVAAGCALLAVLFLLAGWIAPADRARSAFIASGLAGAAGLWVNAATMIPVLAGLGLGAALAGRLARSEPAAGPDPRLWRTWGLAGGAASLLFYMVEYFPSHLGWRLEVNHPLYALAWAGAGDLLARFWSRKGWASVSTPTPVAGVETGDHQPKSARSAAWPVAGAIIALAAPLLLILLAPARTFVVADKFLWTLHVDYISEFAPLLARFQGAAPARIAEILFIQITVLPLIGFVALGLLWRGQLAAKYRALLVLSLLPAAVASLLAWSQLRWVHLAVALWLGVLVAVALATSAPGHFAWSRGRRVAAGLFLALVLLPYPLRALRDGLAHQPGLSRENVRQFVMRDLAFWLQRRAGADGVVVLSGPTATTELVYHGGFQGVGTLYWENLAGLRALVDIYGAATPERALALLQARGVTHLVILPWGPFAEESARLARGLRADAPLPAGAFAVDLLGSGRGLPDWVRPLPYRLPEAEQFQNQFALVLEIDPTQGAAEAAVRRAQFLAALGDPAAGLELVQQILRADPDHLPALVALAQFQRAARQRAAHRTTTGRLLALLSADPALAFGDRIALALELAAAGATDPARRQLGLAWAPARERDVRRLPPETLPLLLRATRDLAVPAPPALTGLAETLLAGDTPPSLR